MHPQLRHRQYQRDAVVGASPEKCVAKIYDIAIAACHRGDRAKVRAAVLQLVHALDFERGGDVAQRLHEIYLYALTESATGSLAPIAEVLDGLRAAWNEGVVLRRTASAA